MRTHIALVFDVVWLTRVIPWLDKNKLCIYSSALSSNQLGNRWVLDCYFLLSFIVADEKVLEKVTAKQFIFRANWSAIRKKHTTELAIFILSKVEALLLFSYLHHFISYCDNFKQSQLGRSVGSIPGSQEFKNLKKSNTIWLVRSHETSRKAQESHQRKSCNFEEQCLIQIFSY